MGDLELDIFIAFNRRHTTGDLQPNASVLSRERGVLVATDRVRTRRDMDYHILELGSSRTCSTIYIWVPSAFLPNYFPAHAWYDRGVNTTFFRSLPQIWELKTSPKNWFWRK